MRYLSGMALAVMTCLPLAACAVPLSQAISAVSTAETAVAFVQTAWSKADVTLFDVEATYGVLQAGMVNFEKAECPHASSHGYCPKLHTDFISADAAVRKAFTSGETFIKDNPSLSPSAVVQAAEAAVNAVAALADNYGVKV